MQFLVDTGADVSVIPPSAAERKHPQTLQLQAVNHTSISTYGIRSLTLNLGLQCTFRWAFIVADVRKPILGADFLHNFSLLVDIKHHQLLDGLTQLCAFRSLVASSTTCSSWSAHLRVVGHPPCIWPRRKRQVIGGPAVTTVHLTTALSLTVIPSLIYKISRPPSTEPRSSANLTS